MPQFSTKELFYEQFANKFEHVMNKYEVDRRIKIVFENLPKDSLKGKLLLDAGCGVGIFSEIAVKKGAKVVSMDVGKQLLMKVKQRCSSQCTVGSITNIPFHNNFFDIVLATESLEHSNDPEKGFDELVRVTKPGGRLIVTVPNKFWKFSLSLANTFRLRPYHGNENWLTWHEINLMATRNNLVVKRLSGFNPIPIFSNRLDWLFRITDNFNKFAGPMMVNIYLSAEKKRL